MIPGHGATSLRENVPLSKTFCSGCFVSLNGRNWLSYDHFCAVQLAKLLKRDYQSDLKRTKFVLILVESAEYASTVHASFYLSFTYLRRHFSYWSGPKS
jgi:hypothetical protein